MLSPTRQRWSDTSPPGRAVAPVPRDFHSAVLTGLSATPRTLPCRYFYDVRGSQLFEQICDQPEYYLTRAEDEILAHHAGALADAMSPDLELVELGSGNARKTRRLLHALTARRHVITYIPVDISGGTLARTATRLRREYPSLHVEPMVAEYGAALDRLRWRRGPRALLFLGSNLGNFDAAEASAFVGRIADVLEPGDVFILGLDRRNDPALLEAAYDDAAGVTAAFNLNLLRRINHELDADFDLDEFAHRAWWNPVRSRIEMHLISRIDQNVHFAGRRFAFHAGESIHTESSYKYDDDEVAALVAGSGLTLTRTFHDADNRYGVHLIRR